MRLTWLMLHPDSRCALDGVAGRPQCYYPLMCRRVCNPAGILTGKPWRSAAPSCKKTPEELVLLVKIEAAGAILHTASNAFALMPRFYRPQAALLNGEWKPPAVQKMIRWYTCERSRVGWNRWPRLGDRQGG